MNIAINSLAARQLLPMVLFVFFSVRIYAQEKSELTFLLSPRVGTELDSNEIEYFNIFPDFDDVRSAVYRKDNYGNIRFLLSFSDGRDTTVNISNLGGEELIRMINQFEKIPDDPKLVNWQLLPGYRPEKLNYFENTGRNATVYCKSGTFSGRLLMISDSAVCIWQRKGDFKPEEVQRFLKRIPYSEIMEIEVRPGFSSKLFGASVGAGLAIASIQLGLNITGNEDYVFSGNSLLLLGLGGLTGAVGGFFFDGITSIGRFQSINQNHLLFSRFSKKHREHAMFRKIIPPELQAFK